MLFDKIVLCLSFWQVLGQEVIYYAAENQESNETRVFKREVDPAFHGHPKTQLEMWTRSFHGINTAFDQIPSLISLLHMISTKYLYDCATVILYDAYVENGEGLLLEQLMRKFPLAYVHGRIGSDNIISEMSILKAISDQCVHYILFMADVMKSADVLGLQSKSKVVVVARSSQWRVQEFLYNKASRNFVNLLVVSQSFREDLTLETPYILYTHDLYIDGLGSSKPHVLTSWAKGKLARPHVSLFPEKMVEGYAGHRFAVIAANQPPFVFRKEFRDGLGNIRVTWDGIELRMLNLLGHRNNFSIEVKEPKDLSIGSGDAVAFEIAKRTGDIGMGGIYVTSDKLNDLDMTASHTQDCAVFISLTSTALPKYRAIMGPFHWHVWVALTFTYLFGIFPLAFSDKHTLRHLIHNAGEIENMFWYVFGTFTNCFTFVGKNSWSKTTKITTRLLIGWYWIFTIIITSCYTGSIIAFVTLPIFPATVDTVQQLVAGNYRVGTLDKGGWDKWFLNSSDKYTTKLFKHLEFVPNIEAGLLNTTRAFFWSYAFLGSKYQLEHVVTTNFTLESSKRSVLHISEECFVPFGVSIIFPKQSVYTDKINMGILRMKQTGIIHKLERDVKWDMQRSSTGKLLQVSSGNTLKAAVPQERGLSLSDTQGMFLLLAAGFLAAGGALLSEWFGGCGRMFRLKRKRKGSSSTISSTVSEKSQIIPTPNSKSDAQSELSKAEEAMMEEYKLNETFIVNNLPIHVNVEEYESGKNVQVDPEIIIHKANGTEIEKKHSREPSYVDWDKEIDHIFDENIYKEDGIKENDNEKAHEDSSKVLTDNEKVPDNNEESSIHPDNNEGIPTHNDEVLSDDVFGEIVLSPETEEMVQKELATK